MNEEQQLSKKERREIKREERDREREGISKKEKMRKIIATIVILILLALFVWLFWPVRDTTVDTSDLGQDYSREIPYQGADHIVVGSQHDPYNSNPPTSGPHWPDPVRDNIYDKSQPDEGLVHSLEHGRIWISYRSSVPEAVKEQIKELAKKQFRVVVTVRDANDTDIAVAAWQRLDAFNLPSDGTLDTKRIEDFIKRYRDKGPEYVPSVTGKEY